MDFICADAFAPPFHKNNFDAVLCHFLLLWLPDPTKCLKNIMHFIKPGGKFIVLAEPDYGGRIDYPLSLQEIGQLQQNALLNQGADPQTGRKLAYYLNQSGFLNVRSGVLGGLWGNSISSDQIQSEWQILQHDLGEIISPAKFKQYQEEDQKAWQSGERIQYVPTFYAWGFKA